MDEADIFRVWVLAFAAGVLVVHIRSAFFSFRDWRELVDRECVTCPPKPAAPLLRGRLMRLIGVILVIVFGILSTVGRLEHDELTLHTPFFQALLLLFLAAWNDLDRRSWMDPDQALDSHIDKIHGRS